jgi:hypothetical protein
MTAGQRPYAGPGQVITVPGEVPEATVRGLPHAGMTRHREAGQESGRVDPAAAAWWHQAQTELAGLIRQEARTTDQVPEAGGEPLLPGSLGDWMEQKVAELEQAQATEPEIDPVG